MLSKVLLIDTFSLAFRAFYSYPTNLSLPDGTPTNVVMGVMSMLFKAIDDLKPSHVCICFDRKEPTFRHEMYPDYKGHRPSPPDDFVVQIPHLKKVIQQCGFTIFDKAGYEADDVIGTLSRQIESKGGHALIMTGDHDALQLVTDQVTVVMNKKGVSSLVHYTPDMVKEKYGFPPLNIVDFKALKGDASDNIPGVPGIGDKTATKLLQTFSDIDTLYKRIEDVTPAKLQEKLRTFHKEAFLSHQLATIFTEVPVTFTSEYAAYQPNWGTILGVFKEYQLNGLVKKYEKNLTDGASLFDAADPVEASVVPTAQPVGQYRAITTESDLKAILPELSSGFAIDLETTSLTSVEAQIVGIALSYREGEGVYIPCNTYLSRVKEDETAALFSTSVSAKDVFTITPFLKLLKPLLEDTDIPKFTHNGKYEAIVLSNYGIELKGISFDTMLAAFLVFPGERVGLKELASRHLGVEMKTYESVTGTGKSQISFSEVPIEEAVEYASADADMTLRLKNYLEPKVIEKRLEDLLYKIELPTQNVLAHMEQEGVCLDVGFLQNLSVEFSQETEVLKAEVFKLAGHEFNLNSTKQLAEVLYDEMQLPVLKKTKTGRSTDSSVLEKLAADYDIANVLMRYRTLEKLLGTYVNALPHMIVPRTHRIHTSFNQTVAITGRLSSNAPNLQNIPIRTEEGQRIRAAFTVQDDSHCLVSADYSQIELRIMADLAGDENMIKAFNEGDDIHARTAAIVHDVPINMVTKEQRYSAKAVNFGILYGQSSFGLSEQLGISRSEAKQIIDDYFEKFPKIKAFMDATIAQSKETGFVKTEYGRYRYLPDINNRVFHLRQFAERAAVNTRVQGTAADIMKMAMVRVYDQLLAKGFLSKLIIQVHDELVLDVVKAELDDVLQLVKTEMETVVSLKVPLVVDLAVGPNWLALEDI